MLQVRLEEWLVQQGIITARQMQRVVQESERTGLGISQVMTQSVMLTERELLEMEASRMGLGFFDPATMPVLPELLERGDLYLARRSRTVCARADGSWVRKPQPCALL